MPFLLRTNTNPGTADWVDESSILPPPAPQQFYLPEVILRPEGPANSDNVFLTAAEARAALNAGSGDRAFVIEVRDPNTIVPLDAGTYGDSDVVMIGRASTGTTTALSLNPQSAFAYPQVRPIVEIDDAILPMTRFESLEFRNSVSISVAPIVDTSNSVFFFTNVRIAFVGGFGPPPAPFMRCDSTTRIEASQFQIARPGNILVGDTHRLDLNLYSGICTSGLGGGFPSGILSEGAGSVLSVQATQDVFEQSVSGIQEAETLLTFVSGFAAGGGTATFSLMGADSTVSFLSRVQFLDTTSPPTVNVPDPTNVPEGWEITYIRDASAGTNATIQSGAFSLYPTDPVSLAPGESLKIVQAGGGWYAV